MSNNKSVGVAAIGLYLPSSYMSAAEISKATKGLWSEEAVIQKLGIKKKTIPGKDDGTQKMGAKAAKKAIEDYNINPLDIDLILCIGEEWKEYPLTTSALYIQDYIKAENAWGIDVQNRCCTTISAMQMARDMMIGNDEINMVMIAGGYRNGDFVDFADKNMSMMYNLGAGGGAIVLKKGMDKNLLLGSHVISDGSLSRTAGVEIGGTKNPINSENCVEAMKSLRLLEPQKMKDRLNEVSMKNWFTCIDKALEKSELRREDIDFMSILHMKRSGHMGLLNEFNLEENQSIYLEDYGHVGQIDQILSLKLALDSYQIKDGSIVCSIAAGIGYVWAANIIKWG